MRVYEVIQDLYYACAGIQHWTNVYEVIEETRAEHNVAHSLVRHRHSVLQVLDELNNNMVVQPFVGRLQTEVQGIVKVGAMFLHRIHDFLHQRSPLLMQSSRIDFRKLHLYMGIRIPNGNKDHGGSRPSPEQTSRFKKL
jgi:hypothetical protein